MVKCMVVYYVAPIVCVGLVMAALGYAMHGLAWAICAGLAGAGAGVMIVTLPELLWRDVEE